ncbi:hypothetical protein AK812_SmicGene33099 [Symbiodinium microadriaticum]|uniref:Uncharacterized protein n=1 Tax=Symbiodinium microadriaticum TaxID=2951 RepID=A0A1Q9CSG9_SYMMI|nr:hypothetical protein AK812_SmicGene33099 [Symbiodinium microadriaticum]
MDRQPIIWTQADEPENYLQIIGAARANSPLRTLVLESMRWSIVLIAGHEPPLELLVVCDVPRTTRATKCSGERRLFLSDWSYDPKLSASKLQVDFAFLDLLINRLSIRRVRSQTIRWVVFIPRTEEKLLLRGQAVFKRGDVPKFRTVQLISSAPDALWQHQQEGTILNDIAESGLRALTAARPQHSTHQHVVELGPEPSWKQEFQQGRMSAADYSSRKVGESIAQIQAAAADLEPLQQLQLWQDVAFAALSDADNITVGNCSKDCARLNTP